MAQPVFRTDLYRGTAADYDRYRLRYPEVMLDDLCRRAGVSGTGRLLDLACGPGTLTFGLCERFAEVWAVDQEREAIELAAGNAERRRVHNVRWMTGRAEDVDPGETFELVTIGNAFHRLDRPRIAGLASGWLRDGGHLALLWSSMPLMGDEPWKVALTATVVEWTARLGVEDRVPAGLEQHLADHPHEEVLAHAGLVLVGHHEFTEHHDWDIESLIGWVYSTSMLPRVALGDQAATFERDVHERLIDIDANGIYPEDVSFAYDLSVGGA